MITSDVCSMKYEYSRILVKWEQNHYQPELKVKLWSKETTNKHKQLFILFFHVYTNIQLCINVVKHTNFIK